MRMNWWPLITVTVPSGTSPSDWDALCAALLEEGCEGFEEQLCGPDGVPEKAIFYFGPIEGGIEIPICDVADRVRRCVESLFGADGWEVICELAPDQDWGAGWREYYHAMRITRRIYVGPPEEGIPANAALDAMYIAIEYDQAFGTGSHATTRGCLAMIEEISASGGYGTLLDVGTGTGVLAFAALRLGFKCAIGMDCDPKAAANYATNAELNRCADRAPFVAGSTIDEAMAAIEERRLPKPDLIVCNMLSDLFDPLLEPMRVLDRPLILSGFLVSETEALKHRLEETGWSVVRQEELDEWGTWFCRPGGG